MNQSSFFGSVLNLQRGSVKKHERTDLNPNLFPRRTGKASFYSTWLRDLSANKAEL